MAYLGNDLQVAFPTYRNIDDISGSFNGVTTSFPLTVAGVAPIPAPINSQQCLISVNGVVQRPDDSGAEGFRLSGGNIIFASAPAGGVDFFGVILAGADYVNIGANFPSGTAVAPSITFDSDLDTGIYNPAGNQIGFTTSGVQRLVINSSGQISGGLGTAAAPVISFISDPNTGIYSPGADQVAISTGGSGRLFVDASGNVGIGTSSLTSGAGRTYLTLGGTTLGSIALKNASNAEVLYIQTGSASVDHYMSVAGYQAFWTNNQERLRITSAGLVGVGTSSPEAKLDITSLGGASNAIGAILRGDAGTGNSGGLALYNSSTDVNQRNWYLVSNSTVYGDFAIKQGNSQGANPVLGTDRFYISRLGNVGVGTTSPSSRLHVLNPSAGPEVSTIERDNSGVFLKLYRNAGSGNQGGLIGADSAGTYFAGGTSTAEMLYIDSGNSVMQFFTSGSERVRIDSSGRVGIGTSVPGTSLHTVGGNVWSGNFYEIGRFQKSSGTGVALGYDNSSYVATIGAYSHDGTASQLSFWTYPGTGNLLERMRIDSSGRVGIGTTASTEMLTLGTNSAGGNLRINSSSAGNNGLLRFYASDGNEKLQFYATTTAAICYTPSSIPLTFEVGGLERFRCDSSGRLLVGTTSLRTTGWTTQVGGEIFQELTNYGGITIFTNTNASEEGSTFTLGKSRGSTAGSNTIVANNDRLGLINFQGTDGTAPKSAAYIQCQVDGTPGANNMPGRIVLSTTADGASSPTERMRINSAGVLKASNNSTYDAGNFHQFNLNTGSQWTLGVLGRNAVDPYGIRVEYTNAAPNGTVSQFLYCVDTAGVKAEIRSNGGLANYSANNANLSDRNAKKDISPAADTWDCIKEWEIVNYRYKDQPDDADLNLGVIAQQVAESCPEVITVFEDAKDDQPEKLGVKEQQMYWMAIKALQEAMERIEVLEQRLTDAGIA